MKYIFIAAVPGSKWSSVARNIYYSPDIDRSDYTENRTYSHSASGSLQPMHVGAYFDPGMEFGNWFHRLSEHSWYECETEFDAPFKGTGVRIIKSHVFCYHIDFLKRTWPDSPVVLVHRGDDASLGWWVKCGHFNIEYPNYAPYYKNLENMSMEISKQNAALRPHWEHASFVHNNVDLCEKIGIAPPPAEYRQDYMEHKIRVKIL
jgi:hypothetical protein